MRSPFGSLKQQFFSWVQLRDLDFVKIGDLSKAFGMTPKQERELLSRLYRGGQIVRLERGRYLVPRKLPPGGKWRPHEFLILAKLMESKKADYQIGGLTAFNRYGLSEQIPNNIFVYNTKISGIRTIAGLTFQFAKVPPGRMGGATELELPTGGRVKIASLGRTLFDAVYDWERFNTLPKAYDWLVAQKGNQSVLSEVVRSAVQYGNMGSMRRIGYLLDRMRAPAGLTTQLRQSLPSPGWTAIPLIPRRPRRGRINERWQIIDNSQEDGTSHVGKPAQG